MTNVTHTSLSSHSAVFQLAGSTVSAFVTGTIADLIDQPELLQLVGGQWRSLDPPMKFSAADRGGVKQAKFNSAATGFRWNIPQAGAAGAHVVSTSVTSS
ncbi:hypothetical protein [Bradyrhizobium guangdongense]|uniref:Uncharacterized protein n=1 Tax=Bradyrhizobium guangdongense TaxID=1325090 RepID=A0A410V707_9BRAD|nr:hypothetical protein [Bradyrhizobium guangdongense]QAU39444.1 hypothetical protein X265_18580 [Bradyrhizobium guangdongense]QOZ60503.1 hypothetical protein XH86_18585 [Bradyrhizobium guangdongense]GGI23791.1 hypothetical protein GCM10010987_26150 [Bradyrhizobium guangdongense]